MDQALTNSQPVIQPQTQQPQPTEVSVVKEEKPVLEKPKVEEKPTSVEKAEEEKEPTQEIKEVDETEELEKLVPKEYYLSSPLFYELAEHFGIPRNDYVQARDKLSVIADWAIMKTKSNDPAHILLAIKQLEERTPKPGWGENRYSNMYRYIRLAGAGGWFSREMEGIKHG